MSWNNNYPPPNGPPNQYPGSPPNNYYGAPSGPPPPQGGSGYGGGYNSGGFAPPGPPPNVPYGSHPGGYNAPPQSSYTHPQSGYAPPPSGYAPPQAPGYAASTPSISSYGPPPGPPPQGYQSPPPQGYQPPQQGYQPPQQGYQPPQQGYQPPQAPGYAPPNNYGPPQPGGQYPPPQGSYIPPPGDLLYLGVWIPSHTTNLNPPPPAQGFQNEIQRMRKATKGFGTDDAAVIEVLAPLDAMQMDQFARGYESSTGTNLVRLLEKETSGKLEYALRGLAQGPLIWDITLLEQSIKGAGTNEQLMTEILIDRTNAEIHALKTVYRLRTGRDLVKAVTDDLSLDTAKFFTMALSGNRDESPPNATHVAEDVRTIKSYRGGDWSEVSRIFLLRSRPHLAQVAEGVLHATGKTLRKFAIDKFSGHMESAMVHAIDGAMPSNLGGVGGYFGVDRDAELIVSAMKGFGTKDEQLIWRVIRNHWDRGRFVAVKAAFQKKEGKTLVARIKSETSGSYQKLLVALAT